jgi:chromosomal replication initiation ATPase DnaA
MEARLMESLTLAESADGERLACDDRHSRSMRMSSLALLRAVERARGLHTPIKTAKPKPKPVVTVKAIPGEGLASGIIRAVAAAYNIEPKVLCGTYRGPYFVHARAVTYRLLRDMTWGDGTQRFSLPQIAQFVGGRDHSTVCHALDQFDTYCRHNPFMRAVYDALRDNGAAECA